MLLGSPPTTWHVTDRPALNGKWLCRRLQRSRSRLLPHGSCSIPTVMGNTFLFSNFPFPWSISMRGRWNCPVEMKPKFHKTLRSAPTTILSYDDSGPVKTCCNSIIHSGTSEQWSSGSGPIFSKHQQLCEHPQVSCLASFYVILCPLGPGKSVEHSERIPAAMLI